MPEACPTCAKVEYLRERCPECPLSKLDAAMDSVEGELLKSAAEIDADVQAGLKVTRSEMNCREYRAYMILRSERARFDAQERLRNASIQARR